MAGAHQLGGDADSFIHANRRNAGSFLAQDVSDLHRNLLQMSRWMSLVIIHIGIHYANCQFEITVLRSCSMSTKVAVILTFLNISLSLTAGGLLSAKARN